MDPRHSRLRPTLVYLLLAALTVLALVALDPGRRLSRPGRVAAPAGTWVSGRADGPTTPGDQPAALVDSGAHAVVRPFTPTATSAAGGPSPTPAPPPNQVGILAGHWKYDTGAVCADGLREVDITTDVAIRVRNILETAGITAEVLPEHDPAHPQAPLLGYRAKALVAVHADVCDLPGYSGFKVARGIHTTTPDADDRLVDCLNREYAAATLLPVHADTISVNMTNYYAFREISGDTPAAIIELGFLHDDRALLAENTYEVARGVANGIQCFLRGQ
jgi:N-acetylmuramoyl-L-alanine amidase